MKNQYNIEYDKEADKITMVSKLSAEEETIEKSIAAFEKMIGREMDEAKKHSQRIKFVITGSLDASLFVGHPNILAEQDQVGVRFSRLPGDASYNYFTMLYT